MKRKDALTHSAMQAEGKALRELIESCGYGIKNAAIAAGIGTAAYLSQILNAVRPLNLDVAVSISRLLNVPIDRFSPRLANVARIAARHIDAGANDASGHSTGVEHHKHKVQEPAFQFVAEWPFESSVDAIRWSRLRPEHKRMIIDFVAARVAEYETIYALSARARTREAQIIEFPRRR